MLVMLLPSKWFRGSGREWLHQMKKQDVKQTKWNTSTNDLITLFMVIFVPSELRSSWMEEKKKSNYRESLTDSFNTPNWSASTGSVWLFLCLCDREWTQNTEWKPLSAKKENSLPVFLQGFFITQRCCLQAYRWSQNLRQGPWVQPEQIQYLELKGFVFIHWFLTHWRTIQISVMELLTKQRFTDAWEFSFSENFEIAQHPTCACIQFYGCFIRSLQISLNPW